MPILRVKVCDADGKPLQGQLVKLTDCDHLSTNADGLAQFLLNPSLEATVSINGTTVWSGAIADLKREEVFTASGSGFVRG